MYIYQTANSRGFPSVPLFKLNKWRFHILTTPTNYGSTPTLSNEGNVPIIALNLSTGLVTMATRSNVLQNKTNSEQKTLKKEMPLQIYNFYKMHEIMVSLQLKYWLQKIIQTSASDFSPGRFADACGNNKWGYRSRSETNYCYVNKEVRQ